MLSRLLSWTMTWTWIPSYLALIVLALLAKVGSFAPVLWPESRLLRNSHMLQMSVTQSVPCCSHHRVAGLSPACQECSLHVTAMCKTAGSFGISPNCSSYATKSVTWLLDEPIRQGLLNLGCNCGVCADLKAAHAHPGFGHAPFLIKVCRGRPAGAAATPEDDYDDDEEDDVDDEDEYEEEEGVEELPGPSYPEPPERE